MNFTLTLAERLVKLRHVLRRRRQVGVEDEEHLARSRLEAFAYGVTLATA